MARSRLASGSSSTIRAVGISSTSSRPAIPEDGGHRTAGFSSIGLSRLSSLLFILKPRLRSCQGCIRGRPRAPVGGSGDAAREQIGDGGPGAEPALGRDPPAVQLDELLDDAESPSPSPRLLNPKSPEEWRLESNWVKNGWNSWFEGPGLEPDAAVGDHDLGLVGRRPAGRSELISPSIGGELDGVGQQVHDAGGDLVGVDLEAAEVVGQIDAERAGGGPGRTARTCSATSRSSVARSTGARWRVWRKSSDRIRVSVLVTSWASCRALSEIRSTSACSCSLRSGLSRRSSSLRPRTSVIGVLNSWLATSMNALLSWPGLGELLVGPRELGVGRLELGDQPLPLGEQVVLLGRLADHALELDRRPRA